jgi:serine/threonine protein kinase
VETDEIATSRIGQLIGGRWTLERVIGAGGMAAVYAARDPSGLAAAVKILHPEVSRSSELRMRFSRELEALQRISHEGVVRILDHGVDRPDIAYLAMELLDGETLADRMVRGEVPSVPELLGWIDALLGALGAVHRAGVVHRDLKPSNLFLTRQGQLKLLDFGVARFASGTGKWPGTQIGTALGTVPYMAPEQAQGRNDLVDHRSDLFAVGAMMFRVLSGQRIHAADTEGELLTAIATKPARSLRSVRPEIPSGIAAVVDLALAFSRNARYPDAPSMETDIQALRRGEPPPLATSRLASLDSETVATRPRQKTPDPVAPTVPDGDPLIGQILAGRYRIDDLLGSGGMGSVYRAEHVHMRKAVAVKVLHREMTALPEIVARFEREAVASARIQHPNVAAATDFGKLEDGSFYLVLEFVEGRSLRDLLDEQRSLAPARASDIARQIAGALAAAHAAQVVHRDLKPDNVMLVAREGVAEFVKVLDFGIAKVVAEEMRDQPVLTQYGSVFGTPEYMSPEQTLGQPVDHRADLYALGILLYEMLAGRTPFADDDMMLVLTRQMTAEPPPLPAHVPPELAKLVMALLRKQPSDRIQSAGEVVTCLSGAGGPVPSSVGPTLVDPDPPSGLSDTVLHLAAPPAVGVAPAAVAGARPESARKGFGGLDRGARELVRALPELWEMARSVGRRGGRLVVRRVAIRGRSWAIWQLGAAMAAVVGLVAVIMLVSPGAGRDQSISPGSSGRPSATASRAPAPDLALLFDPASRGDRAALGKLAARSDAGRSAAEWRALGAGYAVLKDYAASLSAYTAAVRLEPALATDAKLLGDVHRAAEEPTTQAPALDLASTALASGGADLLFDLWSTNKSKPGGKALADAAHGKLDQADVKEHASPALRVALDLMNARGCPGYRALLPRAVEHADTRSLPTLNKLSVARGCGFLGLGDCFYCLRGDAKLGQALENAKSRSAPTFPP